MMMLLTFGVNFFLLVTLSASESLEGVVRSKDSLLTFKKAHEKEWSPKVLRERRIHNKDQQYPSDYFIRNEENAGEEEFGYREVSYLSSIKGRNIRRPIKLIRPIKTRRTQLNKKENFNHNIQPVDSISEPSELIENSVIAATDDLKSVSGFIENSEEDTVPNQENESLAQNLSAKPNSENFLLNNNESQSSDDKFTQTNISHNIELASKKYKKQDQSVKILQESQTNIPEKIENASNNEYIVPEQRTLIDSGEEHFISENISENEEGHIYSASDLKLESNSFNAPERFRSHPNSGNEEPQQMFPNEQSNNFYIQKRPRINKNNEHHEKQFRKEENEDHEPSNRQYFEENIHNKFREHETLPNHFPKAEQNDDESNIFNIPKEIFENEFENKKVKHDLPQKKTENREESIYNTQFRKSKREKKKENVNTVTNEQNFADHQLGTVQQREIIHSDYNAFNVHNDINKPEIHAPNDRFIGHEQQFFVDSFDEYIQPDHQQYGEKINFHHRVPEEQPGIEKHNAPEYHFENFPNREDTIPQYQFGGENNVHNGHPENFPNNQHNKFGPQNIPNLYTEPFVNHNSPEHESISNDGYDSEFFQNEQFIHQTPNFENIIRDEYSAQQSPPENINQYEQAEVLEENEPVYHQDFQQQEFHNNRAPNMQSDHRQNEHFETINQHHDISSENIYNPNPNNQHEQFRNTNPLNDQIPHHQFENDPQSEYNLQNSPANNFNAPINLHSELQFEQKPSQKPENFILNLNNMPDIIQHQPITPSPEVNYNQNEEISSISHIPEDPHPNLSQIHSNSHTRPYESFVHNNINNLNTENYSPNTEPHIPQKDENRFEGHNNNFQTIENSRFHENTRHQNVQERPSPSYNEFYLPVEPSGFEHTSNRASHQPNFNNQFLEHKFSSGLQANNFNSFPSETKRFNSGHSPVLKGNLRTSFEDQIYSPNPHQNKHFGTHSNFQNGNYNKIIEQNRHTDSSSHAQSPPPNFGSHNQQRQHQESESVIPKNSGRATATIQFRLNGPLKQTDRHKGY